MIVFFHQFDIIFDSLKEIEERFRKNPGEQERDPFFYIGYFNMGAIYYNLQQYKRGR